MTEEISAHGAPQGHSGRQFHVQVVQSELHGSFPFDVAVAESTALHVDAERKTAYQLLSAITLCGKLEIKTAELSLDTTHAGKQFGQTTEIGVARTQGQLELRGIRICVRF